MSEPAETFLKRLNMTELSILLGLVYKEMNSRGASALDINSKELHIVLTNLNQLIESLHEMWLMMAKNPPTVGYDKQDYVWTEDMWRDLIVKIKKIKDWFNMIEGIYVE